MLVINFFLHRIRCSNGFKLHVTRCLISLHCMRWVFLKCIKCWQKQSKMLWVYLSLTTLRPRYHWKRVSAREILNDGWNMIHRILSIGNLIVSISWMIMSLNHLKHILIISNYVLFLKISKHILSKFPNIFTYPYSV